MRPRSRTKLAVRSRASASALVLLLAAGCGAGDSGRVGAERQVGPAPPPVRMSMEALHAAGGVPLDWKLTPPPGDPKRGRAVYAAYGCASCHVVRGESFEQSGTSPGPELTGMGAHHPPGYFVESILNPNAIVIEGAGHTSPDGLSTMPAYPDMPLVDLTDLVAYLSSLTAGHDHAAMMAARSALPSVLHERPAPPKQPGTIHLVMRYDVLPGRLADFEAWFQDEGRRRFRAVDGLTAIDTHVAGGAGGPAVVSTFTFRDQRALDAFLQTPEGQALGERWDSFIGPHGHVTSRLPPVYRAESLSLAPVSP